MRHFSNRARERLWDKSRGSNEHPICNIPGCNQPVLIGQRWVESHFPIPRWQGGEATGVAHERCNHQYWCQVEAPQRSKDISTRQKHIGAHKPRRPMQGSRDDPRRLKKKLDGTVDVRKTLRERMIAMGLINVET